ncbi:putative tetratricopeptide-like helical domain-containing protein [Rosa chinensis]|uniref:Putative tetratricopeptide-like helical domain-containing protein n=1 Tax=Rosa chinensis TaxID=74649 RepID=A0A2P6SN57_ROSCH|nr:pentatricopeptide repeat-containing protein At3g60050 [Rosa chinensis]PRQ60092.1 putative tetratricopeptide-like helical domain-containing protein [Rosa chinensis]
MNYISLFGPRVYHRFSCRVVVARKLSDGCFGGNRGENGDGSIEEPISESSDFDPILKEYGLLENESHPQEQFSARRSFFENVRSCTIRILEILQQDEPGFDAKAALDELDIKVSGIIVREVLFEILKIVSYGNKMQCAKLGFKFFVWSGQQENYKHTADAYHLMMKIFANCEEFKAMWRLLDEMIEKGYPTTARTFNILICTCGQAGLARKVVERFIKSKTFNFRPFKHSYNAILLSLLVVKQYKLIEWLYQQMLAEGYLQDILTYNIMMCAKYRLGKLDQFHRLLDEMGRSGFSPDFHTYNLLLHVLGKGDKPLAALNLLNHMKEEGFEPRVLHFTTLIDGLSRAGNMEACKYFFDEMIKYDCLPDVVCYTVMITGYIVAGELEKALELFDVMVTDGQLPNVFTYNSVIRGLCMAGKFEEACSMLKEMESRGVNPNFTVYSTLVSYLRNAGKLSEAHEVIRQMVEKGQYAHLLSNLKRHRRC